MNHISATTGKKGDTFSAFLKVLGLTDEQTRVVSTFELGLMRE
jgi:hypothetical protein